MQPVRMKAMPTAERLENNDSNGFLKRKPMIAVGMLPMIMSVASLPSSVLKSNLVTALRMFVMVLRKNTMAAINVPMWRVTSKNTGMFSPQSCCMMARCPELDMGSHSVML